jgi:hypothetical protein
MDFAIGFIETYLYSVSTDIVAHNFIFPTFQQKVRDSCQVLAAVGTKTIHTTLQLCVTSC